MSSNDNGPNSMDFLLRPRATRKVTQVAGPYQMQDADDYVRVDPRGGTVAVTLPDAGANLGKTFAVRQVGQGTVEVKMFLPAQFIEGDMDTYSLYGDGDCIELLSFGGGWDRV